MPAVQELATLLLATLLWTRTYPVRPARMCIALLVVNQSFDPCEFVDVNSVSGTSTVVNRGSSGSVLWWKQATPKDCRPPSAPYLQASRLSWVTRMSLVGLPYTGLPGTAIMLLQGRSRERAEK
ncbi:uncharacterized protein LOC122247265 [Penaeus japonicus]|uniref:uncharacterized protein LOC122247265 n=1 Tax=Penaeus japonicus TaxID=27405 RepID=UPI001C7152E5|nr:uncharacterized protein LOC122247265 [Penaeus japonicus]